MDAIATLVEEHTLLRRHIMDVREAAERGSDEDLRRALSDAASMFGPALDGHIALEDNDLFPQIANYADPSIVEPFVEDHREIETVRDAVYRQATEVTPALRSQCLTLCSLVQDHNEREEQMLFPMARNMLG